MNSLFVIRRRYFDSVNSCFGCYGLFPTKVELFILLSLHEEPQEVIFLHGIWRHIKEFGIEGQIPRISSPVKLEKRC